MNPEILVAQITLINAVAVAIIGGIFNLAIKRIESRANTQREADLEYRAKREERDKLREERDALNYDLLFATANACDVLLQAAHGDQVNGNVDSARDSIKAAKAECNHFYNKQAAKL